VAFDGDIERDAIEARLRILAGGRLYDSIEDAEALLRDEGGAALPFIVLRWQVPIPVEGDSTMTSTGRELPQILGGSATASASTRSDAQALANGIRNVLVDFKPNGQDATPVSLDGATQWGTLDAQKRPSRHMILVMFSTVFNLDGNFADEIVGGWPSSDIFPSADLFPSTQQA